MSWNHLNQVLAALCQPTVIPHRPDCWLIKFRTDELSYLSDLASSTSGCLRWKDANEALMTCSDIWPLTLNQPISLNPCQLQMVSLSELSADTTSEWFDHFWPQVRVSSVLLLMKMYCFYHCHNCIMQNICWPVRKMRSGSFKNIAFVKIRI